MVRRICRKFRPVSCTCCLGMNTDTSEICKSGENGKYGGNGVESREEN